MEEKMFKWSSTILHILGTIAAVIVFFVFDDMISGLDNTPLSLCITFMCLDCFIGNAHCLLSRLERGQK